MDAAKHLPELISYHRLARKELNSFRIRFKMPGPIREAYQNYLIQFEQSAQVARSQIIQSMVTRLEAWDNDYPNAMLFMMDKIERAGISLQNTQARPVDCDPLTSQHFLKFHQEIYRKGDAQAKEQLKKLSWFSKEKPIPLEIVEVQQNKIQIVPQAFAARIPVKKSWPEWMFKGSNTRYEFFKDKAFLLAQLNRAIDIGSVIINLDKRESITYLLTHIKNQENLISISLEDVAKTTKEKGLSKRLQGKTLQFIQDWENLLKDKRYQQIENKLISAEKIILALADKFKNDPLSAAINCWEICSDLRTLLSEIEQNIHIYGLNNSLQERLKFTQNQIKDLLSLNRAYSNLMLLAKGNLIPEVEVSYLFDYTDLIRMKGEYSAFFTLCQPQIIQINGQLKQLFKQFSFHSKDEQDVQSVMDRILCLNAIMMRYGTQEHNAVIQDQIFKFFLRYLEVVAAGASKSLQINAIQSAEEIILLIGQRVTFAGQTLDSYIEEIQKLRKESSQEVLKCRCLALAMQLANDFTDKRYDKDIETLDNNLRAIIQSDSTLNYSMANVETVLATRDQAIQENKTLSELNLKKSRRVLIGFDNPSTAKVKELLEASITARVLQREMHQVIPLKEKMLKARRLTSELKETLSPDTYKRLCTSKSGRRLLFTKQYIEPGLIPDASDRLLFPTTSKFTV